MNRDTNYNYNEMNRDTNYNEINREINTNRNRRVYINQRPYIIENIRHFSSAPAPSHVPSDTERIHLESTTQRSQLDAHNTFLQNFLNPIEVFPTESQIENATRIVRYCDIVRPNNTSCPISLEPFRENDYVSVIRFCNHIFNTRELNSWFMRNCRCPVCRYDIRNYNSSLNNTINSDSLQNTNEQENDVNEEPNNTTNEQPNNTVNEEPNNNANEIRNDPLFNFLTSYHANTLTDLIINNTNSEFNTNTLINEAIHGLIAIAGLTDVSGNYYFDISGNTIDISGNFIY
jgi:hypothetical protein